MKHPAKSNAPPIHIRNQADTAGVLSFNTRVTPFSIPVCEFARTPVVKSDMPFSTESNTGAFLFVSVRTLNTDGNDMGSSNRTMAIPQKAKNVFCEVY